VNARLFVIGLTPSLLSISKLAILYAFNYILHENLQALVFIGTTAARTEQTNSNWFIFPLILFGTVKNLIPSKK
jgi:hypothetical protein